MAPPKSRLTIDKKTGELVEATSEDQITIGVLPIGEENDTNVQYRKIIRSKLRLKKINAIFKCTAAYIKDQFGNVFWPKDWMFQLLPETSTEKWRYIIVQKEDKPGVDDFANIHYQGATTVLLTHVPIECTESDLRQWILYGLSTEYDNIVEAQLEIEKIRKKQQVLQQRTDELPNKQLEGDKEQQQEMRKKLAAAIEKHSQQLQDDLDKAQRIFKKRQRLLFSEPIQLEKVVDGLNVPEECSWYVHFQSPRGDELARTAIQKPDWYEIRFARKKDNPPYLSVNDDIPEELINYEINLRGIRIHRLKHGQGQFIESKVNVLDEEFHVSSVDSLYIGEWKEGKRHGSGTEYTNSGIYTGNFVEDQRKGKGTLLYGKGDAWEGEFGYSGSTYSYGQHRRKKFIYSLLNPTMFVQGLEHGHGTFQFADGAVYQGEMRNGTITGLGKYTSSAGVIMEGNFIDGVLHGSGCRIEEPNGAVMKGEFRNGTLDGIGQKISTQNDNYEGYFQMGELQGRGIAKYYDGNVYKGFWVHNMKSGRGSLYHGTVRPNIAGEMQHDYFYEGDFMKGMPKARHCNLAMNLEASRQHLPFTTNHPNSKKLQSIIEIAKREAKVEARRTKNAYRRQLREIEHLKSKEHQNLKLYYTLLDEKYEEWTEDVKNDHNDAKLSREERDIVQKERRKIKEQAQLNREMKANRYDMTSQLQKLEHFSKYIDRQSLTLKRQLETC